MRAPVLHHQGISLAPWWGVCHDGMTTMVVLNNCVR